MKDYHEMTQSVLQQAKARAAQRTHQRRMATGLIAATLCLAILITVIGVGMNRQLADTTRPTISVENPTTASTQPTEKDIIVHTGNVYFLTGTEQSVELVPVQANMTIPWDQMIGVRSLKGMTQEQISEAIVEENQAQTAFREKYGSQIGEGRYETFYSKSAIIRHYSAGLASVILLDNSKIESVERKTTGVLNIGRKYGIYQEDYTIGKGEYAVTIPAGSRRIQLDCSLTYETCKVFEENPDTPLSTIRETVTLTINYKNGTKEIVVIDVTVDDNGYIYMTQRGVNAGV